MTNLTKYTIMSALVDSALNEYTKNVAPDMLCIVDVARLNPSSNADRERRVKCLVCDMQTRSMLRPIFSTRAATL